MTLKFGFVVIQGHWKWCCSNFRCSNHLVFSTVMSACSANFCYLCSDGAVKMYVFGTAHLFVNTITLELFEISSWNFYGSKLVDARKIDALDQWCLHMLLGIKWYLFVWNNDVWRLTKQPKLYCYNPIAPAYPVWAYYAHGRQCRCQEDPVSLPSGRLKKTTRSSRITWLSTVQQYLKQHVTLPEAPDLAQNRPLWWMMSTYGATQS